jgi:SsrA-binding protein
MKIIHHNKKARHNYEISTKFEAGISLLGSEVKALREGRCNLGEGWVDLDTGDAILKDVHIGHYAHANIQNHNETRERRLLQKPELKKLSTAITQKGMAVVPIKIYFNKDGRVKLEIAIGKGKKLHDKREASKKRDARRQMDRALKAK